ncbi:MAG: YhcH/YjgK/YiaL family protein [Mangrovibacterium sp.]
MKKLFFLLLIALFSFSCTRQTNKSPEQWSDKELASWFDKGEWKQGWAPQPDETVNKKEFAERYFQYPQRWEKAFAFLATKDLATIEPGRYELEGSDLFVNISEYVTKNEEEVPFEAHQEYADIQYIVTGEEKIGVTTFENKPITVPYDSIRDVAFITSDENNFRPATPEKFFIFFPNDAHRPGVKVNENATVRKVVVKVKISSLQL